MEGKILQEIVDDIDEMYDNDVRSREAWQDLYTEGLVNYYKFFLTRPQFENLGPDLRRTMLDSMFKSVVNGHDSYS